MSSIWTPSGEQPVGRRPSEPAPPPGGGGGRPGRPGTDDDLDPLDPETAARLEALTEELARTPAAVVVANHAMGLFELGALHLSQQPPNLQQAKLAIDAMAALVEGLGGRLDESEATLKEALTQIRLAFVQLNAAAGGAQPG